MTAPQDDFGGPDFGSPDFVGAAPPGPPTPGPAPAPAGGSSISALAGGSNWFLPPAVPRVFLQVIDLITGAEGFGSDAAKPRGLGPKVIPERGAEGLMDDSGNRG